MKYLGGKWKYGKAIAAKIAEYIPFGGVYVEPFCGSCAVAVYLRQMRPDVEIICNDIHGYLIAMLRGIADGSFIPPETITEAEYKRVREHKDDAPALAGFVGFGCSFAGKWFGGYARNQRSADACDEARRGLLSVRDELTTMTFCHGDYAGAQIPAGAVVYCDPPYKNTTGYKSTGVFDYPAFIVWARGLAQSHDVFVSEYAENIDTGAAIVWRHEYPGNMRRAVDAGKAPRRVDVLIKL